MDPYSNDAVYQHTDLVSRVLKPDLKYLKANRSKKLDKRALERAISPLPKRPRFNETVVPHVESFSWIYRTAEFKDIADSLVLQVAPATDIDFDEYCLKDVIDQLNIPKLKVAQLPKDIFYAARTASNPYELVGRSTFINRSAVKLADLDSIYQLCEEGDNLTFADVCGGPGGFAEYLCWRYRDRHVRGWGITLKGPQDYQLAEIESAAESFTTSHGLDGSGDIYSLSNVKHFVKNVLQENSGKVQLVVCDGGLSVVGDELNQEFHVRQLLVSQVLIMLQLVKTGGSCVLKTFDLLHPVSVELIYLAHLMFERISIIKPFTSRPANAERYVVFKNKCSDVPEKILAHLETCLEKFTDLKTTDKHPISAHTHHQPGFIPYPERVQLGLLDVTHIVKPGAIPIKFADSIQASNMKYAILTKACYLPAELAR